MKFVSSGTAGLAQAYNAKQIASDIEAKLSLVQPVSTMVCQRNEY